VLVPLAVGLVCGGAEVAGGVGGAEVATAVVPVVEMPLLARLDELAAAAACDLATGDERLELSSASASFPALSSGTFALSAAPTARPTNGSAWAITAAFSTALGWWRDGLRSGVVPWRGSAVVAVLRDCLVQEREHQRDQPEAQEPNDQEEELEKK
jgi:hypothetical protein